MVRFVIRAADANAPVHVISASRGKVLRAEPVSALYEQGLVHHVGRFAVLEDQLCAFTTAGYRGEGSPDHADALVFAITELMLKRPRGDHRVLPRAGGGGADDGCGRRGAPTRCRSGCGCPRASPAFTVCPVRLYVVGAERVIAVKPEDAAAADRAGFAPRSSNNEHTNLEFETCRRGAPSAAACDGPLCAGLLRTSPAHSADTPVRHSVPPGAAQFLDSGERAGVRVAGRAPVGSSDGAPGRGSS